MARRNIQKTAALDAFIINLRNKSEPCEHLNYKLVVVNALSTSACHMEKFGLHTEWLQSRNNV